MKNWEGENFGRKRPKKICSCPPTISVCPPLIGGTWLFCPPVEAMHAVTIMSLKYRPTIICRHCADQQTDSLVFTEFQSDHLE